MLVSGMMMFLSIVWLLLLLVVNVDVMLFGSLCLFL